VNPAAGLAESAGVRAPLDTPRVRWYEPARCRGVLDLPAENRASAGSRRAPKVPEMPSLDVCAPTLPLSSLLPLASGGVSIDFDKTFLVQMAVFALLVVVLKPLLFDPVLKIFEQREARTEGAKAAAREMQERAGELLRRYERELERVARVAAEERERLRTETTRLEAEILNEARTMALEMVAQGRRKLEAEVNAIQFSLGQQSEMLAREIASRVLGREVT
jgi:F-type H+-transporting ATPase subunit b